jgi:toxin HigB-1
MAYLASAQSLDDLGAGVRPGLNLHALKGDRAGQYAIRINEQYRICFFWTKEGPEQVEIADYH